MAELQAIESKLTLVLDIGTGGVSNYIMERLITFPKGSGIAHSVSVGFPACCLSTFVSNGGVFHLIPTTDMEVLDASILIVRTSIP